MGNGADKYHKEICGFLKNQPIITNNLIFDGEKISGIANRKLIEGSRYEDIVPFYARKPDAELLKK